MSTRMRVMKILGKIIIVAIITVQYCQARQGDDREVFSSDKVKEDHVVSNQNTNQNSIEGEVETKSNTKNLTIDTNEVIEENEVREIEEGEINVGGEDYIFPVAKTKLGLLHGRIEQSRDGHRILAFRGIRHVKPPVGELRFQPPVPAPSWDGIVEAKTNGQVCPQHLATKPDMWVGDEDCLWLNVFTRDLVSSRGRPVIVMIHGGSFTRGSAAEYDGDYLLDQDIVLVTIQYRLGMLGFLSTESSAGPGNYGMHDQVAALHWVRENIAAFSGDPDMVTIMGHQAGGASVHYHLLSPLTRGLFNRAVSLSGSALCWWANIKHSREKAKKVAQMVECPTEVFEDMQKLVDCIRDKPTVMLMNTIPNFYQWKHLQQTQEPLTAWSPRVDPEATVENGQLSFMPQEPIEIMKSGDFQHSSWMTGVTENEGATRAAAFFADKDGVAEFENMFETLGPLMFGLHDGQSEDPMEPLYKVKDYYFGDKISEPALVDAISDSSYNYPVTTAAELHAKNGAKVFLYNFGYRGEYSMTHIKPNEYPPTLLDSPSNHGVGNGDDLIYLFPLYSGLLRPRSPQDAELSTNLLELLTSFVKTGTPSDPPLVWLPLNNTGSQAPVLSIGDVIRMEDSLPVVDRLSFWQSLPVYWNNKLHTSISREEL